MAKRRAIAALVVALAVLGGASAAWALSVGLSPTGGAPGTPYVATVDCPDQPEVALATLDPDHEQETIPPISGSERSPGVWAYPITAGSVDDVVDAHCDGVEALAEFDVDNPIIYLGPLTHPLYPPLSQRTEVDGTDCPAGTNATVTFTGVGTPASVTLPIDRYGDWTTPIPPTITTGDLVVTASCGSVHYPALRIRHRPVLTTTSSTASSTSTPPPTGVMPTVPDAGAPAPAEPAVPVDGSAVLTG